MCKKKLASGTSTLTVPALFWYHKNRQGEGEVGLECGCYLPILTLIKTDTKSIIKPPIDGLHDIQKVVEKDFFI